jgi:CRISPR/Cas system CSM-associated protein Csm5 (group 7 of RAMP superfamily)
MNYSTKLKKVIEPRYGFLDQLVSQGTCDLEQVKVIEDTTSSILRRQKIVKKLAVKLTSNPEDRKLILEMMKMNNQLHVAEFIEQDGCKYIVHHGSIFTVRDGLVKTPVKTLW